jgi:hypothetical protein
VQSPVACRIAAPSEHADSMIRKANGTIHRREFVLRDPCLPNQQWRCMPRWLSMESPLLAAGAEGHQRRELSRSAESARRAGRPEATRNSYGPPKGDTISDSPPKGALSQFD